MPCIYRTRSKNNLLAPHLPTISTKLHSVEEEEEQQCFNQIIPFHAHCTLHILVRQMIGRNFRLQPTTKCCLLKVAPRIWLQGHITVAFEVGSQTTGKRLDDIGYVLVQLQGGRSCANPRTAIAEKFGLGQKILGLIYVFCRDLRVL